MDASLPFPLLRFMEKIESLAAYYPYMVCPGNHEGAMRRMGVFGFDAVWILTGTNLPSLFPRSLGMGRQPTSTLRAT